ncbi:hypothetical protein [Arenimonas composti]|uniref:Uncharacterized protein n=1 Tax=Arenimonas composti TR7-09 = DSM 18010 TaxID=1121013 RepID=A0A091C250_9GAMM|nr:hypothetical protein [Arenimonas composti]KFN50720.1 hypothetical protein P873_06035 [Arenimonas composti TR7-09 = DSM 18010]
MHWLYLLAAFCCLALAMVKTMPSPLVLLFVIGAFVGVVAWIVGWMSARVSGASRDIGQVISPELLRQMREQAEARKAAQTPPTAAANDDEPR